MAFKTGTHDLPSLTAMEALTDVSAEEVGLERIAATLAEDLAAHNALVQQAVTELADVTTERQRVQGTSIDGEMYEAGEYDRVATQKDAAGQLVGIPLRSFQYAIGWTRDFEEKATPAAYAIGQNKAKRAHLAKLRRQIMTALFNPTNYTFVDYTMPDRAALTVKALINADSSLIQQGPNGEEFDGATHTHYNASATLTNAAVQAVIDDVMEHGYTGQIRIYISATDETAFRALTLFSPFVDARLTLKSDANQPTERLDTSRTNNKPIGVFGAAEVWVKPWVPANYLFGFDATSTKKPLLMRRALTRRTGLRLVGEIDLYPLRAEYMKDEFGFAAWNRLNGCVLQFNNASYSAPTFNG